MNNLKVKTKPEVERVIKKYPKEVQEKLLHLRKIILETAKEIGIEELEETLKWGEPSYLAKKGSTIRMDWKEKNPGQYALYFKCTSKLVPAFKEVFGDLFSYETNRAILFQMEEEIPESDLKKCIAAALTYHLVKHLPVLGLKKT